MKYATKLSLDTSALNAFVDVGLPGARNVVLAQHGKGLTGSIGVTRRYVPARQVMGIKQSLPESIREGMLGVNMSEITLLAPHVHTVERCVINFYQQTAGEVTKFYEGDVEPDADWVTDNGNGYFNICVDKITEVESFTANQGDVWLLDVRQPHAVEVVGDDRPGMDRYVPNSDIPRRLVQVYMGLPYAEVASAFS